jgi:hypothetical protein
MLQQLQSKFREIVMTARASLPWGIPHLGLLLELYAGEVGFEHRGERPVPSEHGISGIV